MKEHFLLDEDIIFLNHGSFGACPKVVFKNYQFWQSELEKQPVNFFTKILYPELEKSRKSVANFLGCDQNELIFFQNPTTAVSNIICNLNLKPGDEVLMSSHEYGALIRSWEEWGNANKVKIIKQDLRIPLVDENNFFQDFKKGFTSKTKVLFLSHITSATGLIFPINRVLSYAKEKGIITIIDGAHVPAHIPLNIHDLGCDFYVGALHKWLCGPKGSSFLFVKKDNQKWMKPLVYSWGKYGDDPGPSEFLQDFQWQGTRDMAAFLAIPTAIKFYENYILDNSEMCRKNIKYAFEKLKILFKIDPISIGGDWIGQMVSYPLPKSMPLNLKEELWNNFKIEVPIFDWNGHQYIRISMQIYNKKSDIDTLLNALDNFLKD